MRKFKLVSIIVLMMMVFTACSAPQAAPTDATAPVAKDTAPTAAPVAAEPTTAVKASAEPIKIGAYLPLTGGLAFLGEGYKMGIDLAIKDLGGKIAGRDIEFVVADSKGNPTDSVNAVRKLIEQDKVLAIIGGGASSTTLAALPIIGELKTPAVDASSTNSTIYNKMGVGGNPYQFRIAPDDLIMGLGYTDYIAEKGVKSIAFIGDDNQFGRGAGDVYRKAFGSSEAKMVSEDYFDPTTADFRPYLTRLKASNPEAVLIVMTEQSCATIMRQFRESNLKMAVYSRGACTSGVFNDMVKDNPAIGEGIIELSFFQDGQDPELDKHFFEAYNKPISGHREGGYYVMRYVLAPAIEAVIKSGKELTRDNVRDAIAVMNIETPAGTIKFDDHNQAYPNAALTINKDGVAKLLEQTPMKSVDHTGF